MDIVVFGDSHGEATFLNDVKEKAKNADLVCCLGDMTVFGEEIEAIFKKISLLHSTILLIHGNHETQQEVKEQADKYDNILFLHKKSVTIQGYTFLGFGGDGFSQRSTTFDKCAKKWKKKIGDPQKTILLLHGPPINTTLDAPVEDFHTGSESYREFIEEFQPLAAFAGHIHECELQEDYIEKTFLCNPGPQGAVIKLDSLYKKRSNEKK